MPAAGQAIGVRIVQDRPPCCCNRCASRAHGNEPHIRNHLHISPLLRRGQALLNLQTVNAQENLARKFNSNLDRMMRSDFGHQTAEVL